MKFAHESLKLKSKAQNEDFCFDIKTAQGHFFAVLDFAPHDYANLNATLASKLETVAGSFASLSKFSADLFLGFLAREINNFLHHLSEQSSGPEIFCSAALSLVGGSRLNYLICGDVRIDITGGRQLSLSDQGIEGLEGSNDLKMPDDATVSGPRLDRLGDSNLEAPLTDQVQTFDLLDEDVVLIMTRGLEAGFDRRQLPTDLVDPGSLEPKLICEALMKASASSKDDRTVVVIAGPYQEDVNPLMSDLTKAIASLEARVNALAESEAARAVPTPVVIPETRSTLHDENHRAEIAELKTVLAAKAAQDAKVDEKLMTLTATLEGKADSTDVLGLKHDVSKLTKLAAAPPAFPEEKERETRGGWRQPSIGLMLLSVLLVAVGSAFLGAWLQSRVFRRAPEVVDQQSLPSVVPSPEQSAVAPQPTPNPLENVAEVRVKPGDSLRKFAERYNVPLETLKEMNPSISNWNLIQVGQTIKVPAQPLASSSPAPAAAAAATPDVVSPSGTIEVTVGPGDSLNGFAQRYNSTPERLRELNPQVRNWASIRAGQKLLVPSPPS